MAIGQSITRVDAVAKVTGRARYTEDTLLPGTLHAAYVRSRIAHGRVVSLDASAALAMPGVVAVFTYEDVPKTPYAPAGHPYSLDPEHRDVYDKLLLTDYVRFHGDEVAIVVARDTLTARKASQRVRVEYEEYTPMTRPEQALAPGARELHPGGNLLKRHHFTVGGDLDKALAAADVVVSGDYHTPVAQHCHMEPMTAYAYMDDLQHIVVVSSTQIPHICRRVVGEALEIPWGRVRIVKPYVGGGFGAKQDVVLEPMAAFLTSKLGGRPVLISLAREECIQATRTRHAFHVSGRAAATKEGKLLAVSLNAVSNTGAYASHGHSVAAAGGGKCCSMYPHAVVDYAASTVYTNLPIAGAMRGYGSPQVVYALDCLLEQAAKAIEMDSVDFRLQNTGQPMDVNPLNKHPILTHGLRACLEQGRERFGWERRKFEITQHNAHSPDVKRGVGVASFSFNSGIYPYSVELAGARLLLNQDGSFHLQAGAVEIGQGCDTVLAQMAADTLGVAVADIHVVTQQDTNVTPYDPGAFASRQTYVAGPAVKEAASRLRERILQHASLMTGSPARSLDIQDGAIVSTNDPSHQLLSLGELAMDAYYHKERGGQLSGEASQKTRSNAPSFGCTFVEVEVDIPLCRVRVVDILNVHDAGRIINHGLASGQVQGGMAMGIGWALYEEMLIDPEKGLVRNTNLLDYKIPTFPDLPDLDCFFVETDEPTGGYGNKSLGEPPLLSVAPAIRNAVWDATGLCINEIPMTPKALYTQFAKAGLLAQYEEAE